MHPIWHGQGAYGRALVYFQRCVLSTKITAAASSDPSISTPDPTKFKPLVIPGLTTTEKKRFVLHKAKFSEHHEQKVEAVDWLNAWPCENFFSPSMFPVPIRLGHSKNLVENGGLPPEKYANAELLKIPNFLHLSPAHIAKHCAALKGLTTKWPIGLKTNEDITKHYPFEIVTSTFVNSAPSIRDRRARKVTIRVPLSGLGLDRRARLKLLRLAKVYAFERGMAQYDSQDGILELTSERCPASKQNLDYLTYVLSVLTIESKKHEAWEDEETGSYLDFRWEQSRQRDRLLKLLKIASTDSDSPSSSPDSSAASTSPPLEDQKLEEVVPAVSAYREALETMFTTTPAEELVGPWTSPDARETYKAPHSRSRHRLRHYHWPDIPHAEVPFEPVVGADQPRHLEAYGRAVIQLYTMPPRQPATE